MFETIKYFINIPANANDQMKAICYYSLPGNNGEEGVMAWALSHEGNIISEISIESVSKECWKTNKIAWEKNKKFVHTGSDYIKPGCIMTITAKTWIDKEKFHHWELLHLGSKIIIDDDKLKVKQMQSNLALAIYEVPIYNKWFDPGPYEIPPWWRWKDPGPYRLIMQHNLIMQGLINPVLTDNLVKQMNKKDVEEIIEFAKAYKSGVETTIEILKNKMNKKTKR